MRLIPHSPSLMFDNLLPLGPTDIHITPIGLGTWQFAQNAVVQETLDDGVN